MAKKFTDLLLKAQAAAADIIAIVDPSDNTSKRTTIGGIAAAIAGAFASKALKSDKIDWDDVGRVQFPTITGPAGGNKSATFTVTKRSIVQADASLRTAGSGSVNGYFSFTGPAILNKVERNAANDQPYRFLSTSLYALVDPGTYTINQVTSSAGHDQQSMIVMVTPAPYVW